MVLFTEEIWNKFPNPKQGKYWIFESQKHRKRSLPKVYKNVEGEIVSSQVLPNEMERGGINSFQKQKRKQRRKPWVMSTKQATVLHVAACNLSTGNAVLQRMLLACCVVPLDQHLIQRRNQQKALLWLYWYNCYNMSDLSTLWKIPVRIPRSRKYNPVQIHVPLSMATKERKDRLWHSGYFSFWEYVLLC